MLKFATLRTTIGGGGGGEEKPPTALFVVVSSWRTFWVEKEEGAKGMLLVRSALDPPKCRTDGRGR